MSDTPFTADLGNKHGKTRWPRHRLAVLHPGKFVKAGDYHSVVTEYDGVPFLESVLVSTAF